MRRLVTICASIMALTAALFPASTAAAQDLAVERTISMPAGLEPIGLTVAPAGVPGAGQIYVINFGLDGWELTAFRPNLTIAWRTELTEVTIDPDSLAVAGPGTRRPGAIYVALGSRIAVFDSAGASIPGAEIPMNPPTSKARWVGVYPAAQGGKVIVVRHSNVPDQDDIRWYDDNGVVVDSRPLSAMGNPLVIQSAGPDQGKAYVAKSTNYDGGGKGIYTFNADLSQGADLNVQQNTFGLAASAQDPVLGSYLYIGGSYRPGGFDRRMRLTVMPPAGPWVVQEEGGYRDISGDASIAVSGNSVPGASRVYQAARPEGGAVRTVISIRTLGGALRSQLEIPSESRGIALAGNTPANAGTLYSVAYQAGTLTAMVPPPRRCLACDTGRHTKYRCVRKLPRATGTRGPARSPTRRWRVSRGRSWSNARTPTGQRPAGRHRAICMGHLWCGTWCVTRKPMASGRSGARCQLRSGRWHSSRWRPAPSAHKCGRSPQ